MIEQLISSQGVQDSFLSEASKQPSPANTQDVMRFNMEMSDNTKVDLSPKSDLLQDVKVDPSKIDTQLLNHRTSPAVRNPLGELDSSYHSIMNQIKNVPEFDKFLEIKQSEKAPAVRTNVHETVAKDPAQEVKNMLDETRELYKTAGSYSKDISKWHITTQIWSANIKVLTTVVTQASQGFKTLFRSAG